MNTNYTEKQKETSFPTFRGSDSVAARAGEEVSSAENIPQTPPCVNFRGNKKAAAIPGLTLPKGQVHSETRDGLFYRITDPKAEVNPGSIRLEGRINGLWPVYADNEMGSRIAARYLSRWTDAQTQRRIRCCRQCKAQV